MSLVLCLLMGSAVYGLCVPLCQMVLGFVAVVLVVKYHHSHPLCTVSITLSLSCLSSFKALVSSLVMLGLRWQSHLSMLLVLP